VGADSGDDGLKFIATFGSDANFLTLNLGGDFEFAVANEAGDLFGDRGFEALFDFDDLTGVAQGRNVGFGTLDVFEANIAFGELSHDDFCEGLDFELVLGGEFDFVFFHNDFGITAFEIKTVGELLFGLVDGIIEFHRADLGNDVK